MKVLKIIVLLTCMQLASCQTKRETGFVLEKKKLYYNNKEIALGMPVEKFTDAMGMYDRIVIDSSGGFTNRTWYWIKLRGEAYENEENKIVYVNPYIEDKNEKEYNSIKELVNVLGKYDSIEEKKSPLRIEKLFIWDELGVTLAADRGNDKLIGNIHLQTLYPTKFENLDLGLIKSLEEERGLPITKEVKERRENDKKNIRQSPKKEYTGNFTYNGRTINLKNIGSTGWEKAIKGLSINNSDYDPPGDSPQWSRWIRQSSDMYITFERFSNMDDYNWGEPDKEDVGNLDCIRSIVIWNNTDYPKDEKY
jgi:hypothetical protein